MKMYNRNEEEEEEIKVFFLIYTATVWRFPRVRCQCFDLLRKSN